MADTLQVKIREERGSRAARQMRKEGRIPAVLYGHGEANVSLSIPADQLDAAIRHHSQFVDLTGDVSDSVLLKEVQWDTYGQYVLHLDLIRVSKTEKIEATVRLELHGEAPGAKEGGILEQVIHELEIECRAQDIPDMIHVNINEVQLNGSIQVADLELPPGVTAVTDGEQVVVQCFEPMPTPEEEEEQAALEAGATEPEVIRREGEEEESEEESSE